MTKQLRGQSSCLSCQLAVREYGVRNGRPVLVMHGLAASSRWWDGVVAELRRECHIVAVDLLGHGASPAPRRHDSIETQADLVAAELADRGVVRGATVVGHSLGGLIAVALCERHRDLVAELVLISVIPTLACAKLGYIQRIALRPIIGPVAWWIAGERRRIAHASVLFEPGFPLSRQLLDDLRTADYQSLARSSKMGRQFWRGRPVVERLRNLGNATIVFGRNDHTVDVDQAITAWRNHSHQVVVSATAGHCPHVEAPNEVAALIASVSGLQPSVS